LFNRVLLWRRNDNICFILAFGGTSTITEGTPVQCSIQGILQVRHGFRNRPLLLLCSESG
jgi:hypothetical protein